MSERIVSPGVFTREKDLSFLPQGIAEIGAAIIGPTTKGPAFVPTQVTSFSQFENIFGGLNTNFYVPYTVKEYIKNAPTVTIVRVMGIGGYQHQSVHLKIDSKIGAVLKPSAGAVGTTLNAFTVDPNANTKAALNFTVDDGTTTQKFTSSLDPSSANYLENVLSRDPLNASNHVYIYKLFRTHNEQAGSSDTVTSAMSTVGNGDNFLQDYSNACTPYIISQAIGGVNKNLFKIKTRSHGTNVNDDFKIGIADIAVAGTIAGSDYTAFTLRVLRNAPGKANDGEVLEEFQNLNFDPDSANFLPRAIGDRYVDIDVNGKLIYQGDWPNKSVHIYVSDYKTELKGIGTNVAPMGFNKLVSPTTSSLAPNVSFNTSQTNALTNFDQNVYYGFDFGKTKYDNLEYLAPLVNTSQQSTGANTIFSLENMLGHADAGTSLSGTSADATQAITLSLSHKAQRKFVVPFQGGFDGDNPTIEKKTGGDIPSDGTNTMGFDCSTSAASGSIAFKKAINAVSNPDEFDINLLVTPGIIHAYHPQVTKHGISKMEARADAFYVMDGSGWGQTVSNAVTEVSSLDTNYAAVYYPWVKILDDVKNKPMWVPPSVVLPGVISFTDSVAHEWFAPAGLNRGGLSSVLEAKTRLTHTERDELYEGRVNPIASFPGQGVVVFGQKTLQGKPSALDRINVRRLLIRLRKFIASSSRFLVFEQNTAATRNRFLGIVNPFLESVQANSGLSAFKVVMDDSNNTPDVVDRNQLVGQIFIQPTRTAEFIVLDFVILPTGAAFPE